MTYKIAITRQIPEIGIEYLASKGYDINIWPSTLPPGPEELVSFVEDADGIISMLSDQFSKDILKKLPKLKIISNFAVGHNNINLLTCTRNSVKVTNTPDVLTEATAELTLTLLLSVARKMITATKNVENGEWKSWNPTGFIGTGLKRKTLGIIGPGRIAFEFAKKCHLAFEMPIIYYGRRPKSSFEEHLNAKQMSLKQLLAESDIVSIHCPLTSETKNLIGATELN